MPRPGSRPLLAIGSAAWLAVAATYFFFAYHIVFVLRLGPTAAVVDQSRGWGVHTGDVLALPVSGLGLFCLAVAVTWIHDALNRQPSLVVRPRAVPAI